MTDVQQNGTSFWSVSCNLVLVSVTSLAHVLFRYQFWYQQRAVIGLCYCSYILFI